MPTTQMDMVNIIAKGDGPGAFYAHVFEAPDGKTIEEECTLEEYKALALPNAGQPKKDGYKWKLSFSDHRFDTPTGRLGEEQCALQDNGTWVYKKDGRHCPSSVQPDKSEI